MWRRKPDPPVTHSQIAQAQLRSRGTSNVVSKLALKALAACHGRGLLTGWLSCAHQNPCMPTSTLRPPAVVQPATRPPGPGPASRTSTVYPFLARCQAAPRPALPHTTNTVISCLNIAANIAANTAAEGTDKEHSSQYCSQRNRQRCRSKVKQ